MARLGNENMSFEQAWASAFEGAEMSPSPDLWTRLDARLANTEAKKNKGRLLLFQLLAAASFSLAMGIGIYTFVVNNEPVAPTADGNSPAVVEQSEEMMEDQIAPSAHEQEKSLATTGDQPEENSTDDFGAAKGSADKLAEDMVANQSNQGHKSEDAKDILKPPMVANQPGLLAATPEDTDEILPPLQSGKSKIEALAVSSGMVGFAYLTSLPAEVVSDLQPAEIMVYRVPSNYLKVKKNFEPELWAGVDLSSGVFNPNYGLPGARGFGAASDAAPSSINPELDFGNEARTVGDLAYMGPAKVGAVSTQTNPGVAFSTGLSLGAKVAPRWILLSGLNYGTYQSTSQATGYIDTGEGRIPLAAANVSDVSLASSDVVFDNEFAINNSYQFMSVPMRAGYIVVDRRFSMMLFGGMATDFLLNNRISANNYSDSNIGSGEGDPFRTVYFSGLTGLGLGYSIRQNYLITLEPSYRLALSSLTKPDSFFHSAPNMFSISLGVRFNLQ